MSVESVMNTVSAQEVPAAVSAGQPAGQSNTGKPVVSGVDDIFNLYDGSGDENPAESNGIELKEDKSQVPDELNNVKKDDPKEELKEESKEDDQNPKEETKEEEKPQDETKSDPKKEVVKVKVNGIEKEVPLQEVINSYSGQQEIQRRFTEFDKQKKAFEKEATELKEFTNYAKTELTTIRDSFEGAIHQFETEGTLSKDPMQMLNQMLDKMGLNSNTFNRALFEHNLPEYAKFFNMTDIERDAYFAKKENEYLRQKDVRFNERSQQLKSQEEKRAQEYQMIKDSGLDDVGYESLKSELSDAGAKDLTVEKVIEYAKQKPILDRVVKISEEAKLDLSDPRLPKVKEILARFPDTTDEEILSVLVPERAATNAAKVLQQKQPKTVRPSNRDEDDELEEQINFYRR